MVGHTVLAQLPPLDIHLVGEYAACPWSGSANATNVTSRAYRTKDLNFCIRNVWVRDQAAVGKLDLSKILAEIEAGWKLKPERTMIVRIDFFGPGGADSSGTERHKGDLQSPEIYVNRFLAVLTQLEPVLNKLQGISISEENVPYKDRSWVLQCVYERAKKKYPEVRFFQWWTPNTAIPGFYEGIYLSADGWIVDPYSLHEKKYPKGPTVKRFVQKYLVTGKPLIFVANASNLTGLGELFPDVLNEHLQICHDFNLPVVFYWQYQKPGATGDTVFFGHPTNNELMDKINERVFKWIEQVRAIPSSYQGNAQVADVWDNPPLNVALKLQKKQYGNLIMEDDFNSSKVLDECSGTGFRDLLWNGRELSARGFERRNTHVKLTYKIVSDKPMKWPHVSLDARVDPLLKGVVRISLSCDSGKTWAVTAETEQRNEVQTLTARTWFMPEFLECTELWVNIEMQGEPGSDERSPAGIDDLRIWSSDSQTKVLQK